MSLTLEEFSDRELLFALEEHADNDGSISSLELAEGLGLVASNGLPHPQQNIAVRLSWLRRYGVVDRLDNKRWVLSEAGSRIVHGALRASERRVLSELDDDKLFAVMTHLGSSVIAAHDEAATMVARHWRYSLAERKRNRTGRR